MPTSAPRRPPSQAGSRPLTSVDVGPRRGLRSGARMTAAVSGLSVLAGRDAELERADRLIEGVIGRCGSLLLIEGEARIGKTSPPT